MMKFGKIEKKVKNDNGGVKAYSYDEWRKI